MEPVLIAVKLYTIILVGAIVCDLIRPVGRFQRTRTLCPILSSSPPRRGRTMTLEGFLAALSAHPEWTFGGHWGKAIRTPERLCPLQQICLNVTGVYHEPWEFVQAGMALGLSWRETHTIFRASDNEQDANQFPEDHEMRRRLLEACRLGG